MLLGVLLPIAAAGVPFEMAYEDPAGDVQSTDSRATRVDHPSSDIIAFDSSVVDGRVIQRVTMAARPTAPEDSILVRSWYRNSTNDSFHVIDMEVRGDVPEPSQRFQPVRREGSFYNASAIEAHYGLDDATWIFDFDEDLVEDASCFDAGVFSEYTPSSRRVPGGMDSAYLRTARFCATAEEPAPEPDVLGLRVGMPSPPPAEEPPGTRAPAPSVEPILVVTLVGIGALLRTRRSR
jgi:hypothetical protein